MACNERYGSNCYDSCDQIEGIFEAANNLIQYRDIIEKWLHGDQNDMVQIGGEQVKTLLGLISDIKQLVGVLPDGRTIILDDKKKVLSVLLAAGGGLAVKPEGGIYVNIDTESGLKFDDEGNISIDFSQMPTDRFEELMKQIRVPIWLEDDRNLYVNGATGSDTLDEGRGESEGKPFKTLQAAINYVTDNYNISRFTAAINVANSAEYSPIILPDYSRTTGKIVIQGQEGSPFTIAYDGFGTSIVSCRGGVWDVNNVGISAIVRNNQESKSAQNCSAFACSGGNLNINKVKIDIKYSDEEKNNSVNIRITSCSGGELIVGDCNILTSKQNNDVNFYGFSSSGNGVIRFPDSNFESYVCSLSGDFKVIVDCFNLGRIVCNYSGLQNKYNFTSSGSFSGKKYQCTTGGTVNTGGQGPDYFPGTTPGTVDASTYCWYE